MGLQGTGEPGGYEPEGRWGRGGAGPCLDLDSAFPTSHVEVGG